MDRSLTDLLLVGLARTIYIQYMHGVFGTEATIYTVIYGVCMYTVLANPTLKGISCKDKHEQQFSADQRQCRVRADSRVIGSPAAVRPAIVRPAGL